MKNVLDQIRHPYNFNKAIKFNSFTELYRHILFTHENSFPPNVLFLYISDLDKYFNDLFSDRIILQLPPNKSKIIHKATTQLNSTNHCQFLSTI